MTAARFVRHRSSYLAAFGCCGFASTCSTPISFPNFHTLTLRLSTWVKRKPLIVTWREVWDRAYWRKDLGWLADVAWFVEWLTTRAPDHLIAASEETPTGCVMRG